MSRWGWVEEIVEEVKNELEEVASDATSESAEDHDKGEENWPFLTLSYPWLGNPPTCIESPVAPIPLIWLSLSVSYIKES